MSNWFSPCMVRCCICTKEMDWMKRYGRVAACCSPACWREFDWRQTLAILGEKYRPQPKCEEKKDVKRED